MKRVYGGILNAAFMEDAASRAGLRDAFLLEDFVIDFGLRNMIGANHGACLRGGIAGPFRIDRGRRGSARASDCLYLWRRKASRQKFLNWGQAGLSRHGDQRAGGGPQACPPAAVAAVPHQMRFNSGAIRDVRADISYSPAPWSIPVTACKSGATNWESRGRGPPARRPPKFHMLRPPPDAARMPQGIRMLGPPPLLAPPAPRHFMPGRPAATRQGGGRNALCKLAKPYRPRPAAATGSRFAPAPCASDGAGLPQGAPL